jgi:hypothetical protein
LNQFVGTAHAGSRFDLDALARQVLPLPGETEDVELAFARRYSELEGFLVTEEVEFVTVWPLAGLTSSTFPIALEQGVELDIMPDEELSVMLDTEVLRPFFPGVPVLPSAQDHCACLRYRWRSSKVIGDLEFSQARDQVDASEEALNTIEGTLEQALALLFPDPVPVSGRATFAGGWTPSSAGVAFRHAPLTAAELYRQVHLDEGGSAEMVEIWRQLRQCQVPAALALGLRRLSYQAHRQRVEDELVDILIAGEALYLSDASSTSELGFRLALRASALCDPEILAMTRRDVFDLMKAAYLVRSKVVHGEVPKPRDLKVRNVHTSFADLVQATASVVRQGLREALNRATSPRDHWPPDWYGMTLPK